MVKRRSIGIAILLSFVTFGIYGIYWFITITDEASYLADDRSISGITTFLLSLITFGIYSLFWAYKMGKIMEQAKKKHGKLATDNSIIYLILELFALNLVVLCLIQSEINSIVE